MTQPRELLTTGEAARKLDVTDETIRRWIVAGKLRAITLPSGQKRVLLADVEAILSNYTDETTEPVAS